LAERNFNFPKGNILFPEKTTALCAKGPFGTCPRERVSGTKSGLVTSSQRGPAQTKKKKNWDNFLAKGRPRDAIILFSDKQRKNIANILIFP
jgi:hypothetical protein